MTPHTKELAPAAWDALAEALSTYEWYKLQFERLVRRLFADAAAALARLNFDDPKRRVAGELVDGLRARESECQELVVDALIELSRYDERFLNLARLDDGAEKVEAAQAALRELKAVVELHSQLAQEREQLLEEFSRQADLAGLAEPTSPNSGSCTMPSSHFTAQRILSSAVGTLRGF